MTVAEDHDESIRTAVARESKRRKRALLMYLGLVLFSIAIGGLAIAKAPSETQAVANDVTPIVSQRVEEKVSDSVTQRVITQAGPLIEKKVAAQVATTVAPRFGELQQSTTALQADLLAVGRNLETMRTTVDQSAQFIETARVPLAAIPALETRFIELDAATKGSLAEIQTEQAGIRSALGAQQTEVKQLAAGNEEQRVKTERLISHNRLVLRTEMERLIAQEVDLRLSGALKEIRVSVARQEGALTALTKRVDALTGRVDAIQKHLQSQRVE